MHYTSITQPEAQNKPQLHFNKKEIDLIRYTWNNILLDDQEEERILPGGFPGSGGSKTNGIIGTSGSTVASSLFCHELYSNLLTKSPGLKKLFPLIKHQAVSFAGVLSLAITQLENMSNLDDYLVSLGKRHLRMLGIEAESFQLMGEALIQTFHERVGDKFDQELEELWIKLYLHLANLILQFGIDPVMRFD